MHEREERQARQPSSKDPWQLYRIEARLIIIDRELGYLIRHLDRVDRTGELARRLDTATEGLAKVVKDNPLP